METPKTLQDLIDLTLESEKGEQLYYSTVDLLEMIKNPDIRADVALNLLKFVATRNATKGAKSLEEEAERFETEVKRFAADLLRLPEQFRKFMREEAEPRGITIEAMFANGCGNCPTCLARKAREEARQKDAS